MSNLYVRGVINVRFCDRIEDHRKRWAMPSFWARTVLPSPSRAIIAVVLRVMCEPSASVRSVSVIALRFVWPVLYNLKGSPEIRRLSLQNRLRHPPNSVPETLLSQAELRPCYYSRPQAIHDSGTATKQQNALWRNDLFISSLNSLKW
jgi:hypothetical protein